MSQSLRTNDIVKQTGLGRETLRFYEKRGLIPRPARTASGYRAYAPDTLSRIGFIKRAQAAGFSLREIQQMLKLKVGPATTCGSMEKIARKKIEEIEAKIESLQAMRKTLNDFAHACRKGRAQQCNIIIQGLAGNCCEKP